MADIFTQFYCLLLKAVGATICLMPFDKTIYFGSVEAALITVNDSWFPCVVPGCSLITRLNHMKSQLL